MTQFSGLNRLQQYDRCLYRVGNLNVRLFDENLNGEGRPDIGFSKWLMLAGTVEGTYRLRLYDRFLYRVGNFGTDLYDESLNDEGRPDVGFSNWNILPGTVHGTFRLKQYDRILYRLGNVDVRLYDESLNDEGRPDVGFSNWNITPVDADMGEPAGKVLQAIIQDAAKTPYPVFTGDEASAYQYLVTQFSQRFAGSPASDLRTDVYPRPLTYAPSTVYTVLSTINAPTTVPAAAWSAVLSQVRTEVSSLVNLLQFQTEFATSANSIATEWTSRFQTAVGTLNGSGSGSLSFLGLCSTAFTAFGKIDPALAPVGTIMGAFYSAAQNMSSDRVSGSLSDLQTQLAQLIENTVTSAANIYSPIAGDWGKLQRFQALANLPTTSPTLSKDTISKIGDSYEISIYQAVIPSNMAIVSFAQYGWGDSRGSREGVGLAYVPERHGMSGKNDGLCRRLIALGINFDDVVNRSGPWGTLPTWECVSTFRGTMCLST